MDYQIDDHVTAAEFVQLANYIWPGNYDEALVEEALSVTINITARDNHKLVGCLRVLTDGYFFSTIPEALVLPNYQRRGIGAHLFELAKDAAPSSIFFGAQPDKERFYEGRGFEKSLQSFHFKKPRRNA
jgi:GNAT superfamily N-acetyltransferase